MTRRSGLGGWAGCWAALCCVCGAAASRSGSWTALAAYSALALLCAAFGLLCLRVSRLHGNCGRGRVGELPAGSTLHRSPRGVTRALRRCAVTGSDRPSPLVLLCHGMSTPLEVFDPLVSALVGANFDVLSFDLYGRGYSSPADSARHTLELFVEQIDQLLADEKIDTKFHLVGLSLGGPIVSSFSVRYPDKVLSITWIAPLIRCAPLPRVLHISLRMAPELVAGLYGLTFNGPAAFREELNDWSAHEAWNRHMAEEVIAAGLRENPAARSSLAQTLLDELKPALLNPSSDKYVSIHRQAAGLGRPVLLVQGRQDATCAAEEAAKLAGSVAGGGVEVVMVDRAGHYPHLDQRALVSARLIEFLRSSPPGGE